MKYEINKMKINNIQQQQQKEDQVIKVMKFGMSRRL